MEPTLHQVRMTLCNLCLTGAGGECHVPGCAMFLNRAPDLSLMDNPMVESVDERPLCYEQDCQAKVPHPRATKIVHGRWMCSACATWFDMPIEMRRAR